MPLSFASFNDRMAKGCFESFCKSYRLFTLSDVNPINSFNEIWFFCVSINSQTTLTGRYL
jgi:hypothetical protein